jgi:hypothetical protein
MDYGDRGSSGEQWSNLYILKNSQDLDNAFDVRCNGSE